MGPGKSYAVEKRSVLEVVEFTDDVCRVSVVGIGFVLRLIAYPDFESRDVTLGVLFFYEIIPDRRIVTLIVIHFINGVEHVVVGLEMLRQGDP